MACQRGDLLQCGRVPQSDGGIQQPACYDAAVSRSKEGAIGRKQHRGDRAHMTSEDGHLLLGGHVPQPDRAIVKPRDQPRPHPAKRPPG